MIIKPDSHRKFNRTSFDRHVDIEFISDKYDNCQIKDLSLAGMFVKGDFKQDHVETKCSINFVQDGISTNLCLEMHAKVVRRNDDGIAVEFSSMPFDSYIFLQSSLIHETEDSILLSNLLIETCPFNIAV